MACIKSVNRSASVALSPLGPYMAAGTMAGAVDMSFSTTAYLEVFKIDFSTDADDHELPVLAQSPASERFNRLSWGKNPATNSEEFSDGIIAGGLLDGTIALWNPAPLIRSEANSNPVVGQLSKHKGPVRGLEFNAISPHLLASGADEGEICIWDLASPKDPTHFPPLKGSGSAAQGEISYLAWNSKVPHILASTSYNGTTVVWDLKKQKPVISFADSTRRRCSVLQWNPDVATQLVVASDDDNSPALRLWDMRNVMSPVKEFVGHSKGVISMAWCPTDSSYFLTCAKDNRTICWDTVSGGIVCELPAGTNWNFDVHWYPKIPGVISASSFDGKIGLYNIEACDRQSAVETDSGAVVHAAPLRAPKWYKRPVGVSFGFGGKLVSFHSKASTAGAPVGASEVFVHTLVTEDSLVARSSEFEAALQIGESEDRTTSLRVLCEKKLQESESEDDRETWGFLRVMFEDSGASRPKLVSHLGFTIPEEVVETVEDDLSQQVDALGLADNGADTAAEKDATAYLLDNGEDFFNSLPSPKADTPVSTSVNTFVADAVPSEEQRQTESEALDESDDPAFDDAIQRALVVADYKGAVAQCISANKMADALVIAHVGGDSLWEQTRAQYLNMCRSPYLKVVSAMVNRDLMSLVNSRPLKSWKETLALLCTFAQNDEWEVLCDALASRLLAGGYTLAATLSYICAGNIDKTVEIWSRSLSVEHEGKPYVDRLQDLMEKTIIFAIASGQKQFSSFLCKLVEKYAEILASQGQLSTAMEYLKLLGDNLSPELVILRDRIAVSSQPEKEVLYGDHNSYVHGKPQPHYQDNGPHQNPQFPPQIPSAADPSYQIPYTPTYSGPYTPTPQQSGTQPRPSFVPHPNPQVPQPIYSPSTVNTQLGGGGFVPSNLERDVPPYQPAPPQSLPSPLTGPPGSFQPNYQTPGQNLPQAVTPNRPSFNFMPVFSPGVAQRPAMTPTLPGNSAQPGPGPVQPSVAPPAPPPTVQTADTSNVPAHLKPVVSTLTRLFNETSQALGGAGANPAKKREIEDNSRKFGTLFAKLNTGDISKNASDKLVQLCQALDDGDFGTALQIQVLLTTSEWDECSFWLGNIKRMIKTRQSVIL